LDEGALLQALGCDNVALLAVQVVEQRDVRGAVRVVLDVRDLGRHAVLVIATEVDDAVLALVAAALVAGGDVTVDVAATGLRQRAQQRLLQSGASDLAELGAGALAATRRSRLVLANSHTFALP